MLCGNPLRCRLRTWTDLWNRRLCGQHLNIFFDLSQVNGHPVFVLRPHLVFTRAASYINNVTDINFFFNDFFNNLFKDFYKYNFVISDTGRTYTSAIRGYIPTKWMLF
ncbi:hypothetical protein THARTR1_06759 [Trichoderma harzianum]|uniref:Uncharacterized protein n=1 Tax=Trichoderma harzianum TaxID=5544 RepID=A0A2K0U4J1_TRIHA|nr:hypothetical protein THARTR1_06759 [Trichoderma harzianum]